MIYSLDTNVVVDALRQPDEMEELKAFLTWALPLTVLSSVVVAELAAGARTERARRALDEGLVGTFERRARILAPSRHAWHRAGAALGRSGASSVSASRQNDVLLAFQAREVRLDAHHPRPGFCGAPLARARAQGGGTIPHAAYVSGLTV